MDYNLTGSSVRGISQARILEWVAISFSRRSSRHRDWTRVSHIVGRHFTVWARSQEKWPLNGSLSYDTTLQLDLYCRRKFKWSELPYVQIFMAMYLDSETQKEFMVYVFQRENSSKETEDILTDLPCGAIQRLNPLEDLRRSQSYSLPAGRNHYLRERHN